MRLIIGGFGEFFLSCGFSDDDEVPWLDVACGWGVACRFDELYDFFFLCFFCL
jgi:hypothetical protein